MRNTYAIASNVVGAKAPELRVRVIEEFSAGETAVVVTADLRDTGRWFCVRTHQLRPIDDNPSQVIHDSGLVFMESI